MLVNQFPIDLLLGKMQAVRKIKMFDDNKMSLTLTSNPKSQNYIKYIDMTDVLSFTRFDRR